MSGVGQEGIPPECYLAIQRIKKVFDDYEKIPNSHELFNDKKFKSFAEDIVCTVKAFAPGCILTSYRINQRLPTIHELWNYCIYLTIPKQSWIALWKVPNQERKGWPMHYITKAKVLVGLVRFANPVSAPVVTPVVIQSMDNEIPEGDFIPEVPIWQLEPIRSGSNFDNNGRFIEEGKYYLATIRRFFEGLHFPCDTDQLVPYVENTLFERLRLNYDLEKGLNPPLHGKKDREHLIGMIKLYHSLNDDIRQCTNVLPGEDERGKNQQEQKSTLQTELNMHLWSLKLVLNSNPAGTHQYNPNKKFFCRRLSVFDSPRRDKEESVEQFLVVDGLRLHVDVMQNLLDSLRGLESFSSAIDLQFRSDLDTALKQCTGGARIFVPTGQYRIKDLGNLAKGGEIIGMSVNNRVGGVVISPSDEASDTWLIASPENSTLLLENLTFILNETPRCVRTLLFVTLGNVTLRNCTFINNVSAEHFRTHAIERMPPPRCPHNESLCVVKTEIFEGNEAASGLNVIKRRNCGKIKREEECTIINFGNKAKLLAHQV